MSLHDETKAAENEYTQSVKDIADTRLAQAEDMANFSQFSTEATNLAKEQADLDRNLSRATVNDANTSTATAKDAYREQALANNQTASYRDYLNSAIEKKQKKNQNRHYPCQRNSNAGIQKSPEGRQFPLTVQKQQQRFRTAFCAGIAVLFEEAFFRSLRIYCFCKSCNRSYR